MKSLRIDLVSEIIDSMIFCFGLIVEDILLKEKLFIWIPSLFDWLKGANNLK